MFGLPHSGSDVCGYYANGEALDEELCLRWYQLATFFPLARHSQEEKNARTEPFNLKSAAIQAQIQKSMHDRMQYLRLMYTCMFQTSNSGGTCLTPLQFQFTVPVSKWGKSLPDFTNTFMFASSLKVSPIMNATGAETTFQSYFPVVNGSWVNMADWSEIVTGTDDLVTLQVRDTVNVHLAPGALIPFQNNTDMTIMTTVDALKKPISLILNRDTNMQAGGELFLDLGESQAEINHRTYDYYNLQAQAGSIQFQPSGDNQGTQPHVLDQIVLVNAGDLNETNFACYFTPSSLVPQPLNTWYNTEKKALVLLPATSTKFSQILNIYYGSSNNKDLNICNQHSFEYDIVGGVVPDLSQAKSVHINLTHKAGTLDDITLYLGFHDSGIIHVQWAWAN